jgi:hypothetical protein
VFERKSVQLEHLFAPTERVVLVNTIGVPDHDEIWSFKKTRKRGKGADSERGHPQGNPENIWGQRYGQYIAREINVLNNETQAVTRNNAESSYQRFH